MLRQEQIKIDGRDLVKSYSDANKYIIQKETGIYYTEAIDVPNRYTYTESDKDIEDETGV